ncbi:MAG: glutamyl-tRNA reductase [Clostridia bacterium]|nr:glutamyl-tRNA reductase [Clostridia bacterium]MCL6523013.1 glutamyl-tRNA reductase [Bacillota bacterium]
MSIVVVGLNHKTARLAVRERASWPEEEIPAALRGLAALPGVHEAAILATCNRVEIYAAVENPAREAGRIRAWWGDGRGLGPHLEESGYVYVDAEAAGHLFAVAAGLDSLVLGETQILGQVRHAYRLAQLAGTMGKNLYELFDRALATAKRVHTETALSRTPASVPHAAAELVRGIFPDLAERALLVVGAGRTAALAARQLAAARPGRLIIANRTPARAAALAAELGAEAAGLEALEALLAQADVVLTATSAPRLLVTREMVARALVGRQRPLFLVDIAVPRNVDPQAGSLEGAYLYVVDDLQVLVARELEARARETARARALVAEEVEAFREWQASQNVVPLVRRLVDRAEGVRRAELEKTFHRLAGLDERERQALEQLTASIVHKLLHDPIEALKEGASHPEGADLAAAFRRLFRLEEEGGEADEAGGRREAAAALREGGA